MPKTTKSREASKANGDEVLTLVETAKLVKVSERTLWELAKANAIPHFKVGKQYRFLRSSIQRWAQAQS